MASIDPSRAWELMKELSATPRSRLAPTQVKQLQAMVSAYKRERERPLIEEAARQYATAGFTPPEETPARQLVGRFTGAFGESLTFGLYRPQLEPPKTLGEKVAYYAGRVLGTVPAVQASYAATAPLFAGVKAATPLARFGLEGLKGVVAGAAYGVPRAAAEVATGRAGPREIPRIIAEEAVYGSIGDFILAGARYLLDLRALKRMGTAARPDTVDNALRAVSRMAEEGRPPEEMASVLRSIPKTGDAEVDRGIDEMVSALVRQGEMPQVAKPYMQVEPRPEIPEGEVPFLQPVPKAQPKARVPKAPEVKRAAAAPEVAPEAPRPPAPRVPEVVPEAPKVPEVKPPNVPGAEAPQVPGAFREAPSKPKGVPPSLSRKVFRGRHGAVNLVFEKPEHAELFDLWSKFSKASKGEDVPLGDIVFQLSRRLGIPQEEIGRVMIRYRDSILEAVKSLPEGATYRVPPPELPTAPAATAIRPAPEALPELRPGQKVKVFDYPTVHTVVEPSLPDAPELALIRRPDGMEIRMGRAALRPVEEAKLPEATPPKVEAPKPPEPTLKVGQKVRLRGKEQVFTVVDVSDPSLVVLETEAGTRLKAGRLAVEPVSAEPTVRAAKPPAEAAKPYEGLRPGTPEWMEVWRAHPELQAEMLQYRKRFAAPALEKPKDLVDAVIDRHYEAARPLISGPEPVGIMAEAFARGMTIPKAPTLELERALTATKGPLTKLRAIAGRVKRYADSIADAVVYHRSIKDYPWLRNATRLFEGSVQDASDKAIKALVGVTAGGTEADFELFRRLVVLRDLSYVASQGKALPKGVTADAVNAYLSQLLSEASPTVRDMLRRHDELMTAVGLELVRRGKLAPESLQAAYFPHYVIDYLSDEANFAYLPRRLREPYRYYTKERVGSLRDIDTDYLAVMYRHLTKVFMDNAVDDFAEAVARQYDASDLLRAMGREPKPRVRYEINDKEYVGWQYAPGNRIYPAVTPFEKAVTDAIAQGMTVEEFLAGNIVRGPRGGITLIPGGPLREVPALGGPKPVYVLPVEVARHLDNLRHRQLAEWAEALADVMSLWKRTTLGFAGVPFQVNNLVGDLLNLYREDPRAFLAFRDAWNAVVKGQAPADIPDLLKLLREQRVIGSGMIRRAVTPYLAEPALARLQPWKAGVARYNPLSLYEQISEIREDLPRVMKFITDLRRIRAGKQVVAKAVDIAGLPPIEAAGKVAREFTVDYGKLTPEMKGARRILFPFLTFYVENAKNWWRYVTRNPGDATVKFGIPLGLIWLWNNTIQRDVEEKLPEYWRWLPHINTGYVTEDGKPIIIGLQTPLDMAARMVGLDRLPDKITRVRAGEMTVEEAAVEQLKDMGLAPLRQAWNLFNPMAKAIIDIYARNRDSFTGATIVPERLKGTSEERRLQLQYAVKQLLTPYAQYMRAQQELEPGDAFWRTMLSGPLDIKRAAGIREIDLEAAEGRRMWERIDEAERQARERKHALEEAYIAFLVTGSAEPLTALVQQGVPVTANEMRNLAQNPRVRAEAVRRMLRLERDPERRRALEEELRFWQQAQQIEAVKGVSPPERAALLGGGR